MNVYKNGNYVVCIFEDGTKIRQTEEDDFQPDFSESTDVKITNKCSTGCKFCYEGSSSNGKHGDLFKYDFINTLHPFTEMALNGNDLDHPQLEKFLEFLKSKQVFANMTFHQRQFLKNIDKIKDFVNRKLLYGIGVSYEKYSEELIKGLSEFPNAVLHVICGIITEKDIENLKNHNIKLLILGYKNLGRGKKYLSNKSKIINKNKQYLYDNISELTKSTAFKVISFDNLALSDLDIKRLLTPDQWEEFYMGDDGKFTFYIDMVKGEFAKNSLSTERFEIGNKSIDEMFNIIRTT